ncbi:MAG: zinc-ribbon domain-containing protein [Lachnospiraceae bacterium]|nr:zinc-ribbon domain-containing protein [Lachnospiraceae bacterium]
MEGKSNTARYRIITDTGGNKYRFFCALSGAAICTTKPVCGDTQEEELKIAWEEGKQYFNHCHKCGNWVGDAMYNADVFQCVACAPWEARPEFCSQCGTKISPGDTFCKECGSRLRYMEVTI